VHVEQDQKFLIKPDQNPKEVRLLRRKLPEEKAPERQQREDNIDIRGY